MNAVVTQICQYVFSEEPISVVPILDLGLVNHTFRVEVSTGSFIFRLNASEHLETYEKEAWCMEAAGSRQIPTSRVHALGVLDSHAYSIQPQILGVTASLLGESQTSTWENLGRYARQINQIPCTPSDFAQRPWSEQIAHWQCSLPALLSTIKLQGWDALQIGLGNLASLSLAPSLCHGNISLRNTIIHPGGTPWLIDWGNACAAPAPYWDLSEILAWNRQPEYAHAFLRGYRLGPEWMDNHHVKTLLILRQVETIHWASETWSDWETRDFVIFARGRVLSRFQAEP